MTAIRRLFSEGYRVFFLAAGLYAVVVMIVWTGWLGVHAAGGMAELPTSMAPHLWHGHELIFGFGTAALGGFFLTAVPNWTGARAAPGRFIAVVTGLWLLGRVAMWYSGALPPGLVAVADLAFVPVLAAKIATQLIKRPKPQNMLFLVLLSLVWVANLLTHLDWMGLTGTADAGLRGGLYSLVAMIAVLGGRVTPAFTRNAMVREGRTGGLPVSRLWLDRPGIAAAIALPVVALVDAPASMLAAVALAAGGFQLARVAGWRPGFAARQPILLALHLSFALIGLGLILTGLAALDIGSAVAALHVLAVGGVAGMVLAVASRATLGHSGRPLVAPGLVVVAYGLMPLAAALRWLASTYPADAYYPATLAAGFVWILAFTLYVAALWPAFWGPRTKGGAQ